MTKRQKGGIQTAAGDEQKGETESQTAAVKQKVKKNRSKKEMREGKDKESEKSETKSSGEKFKRWSISQALNSIVI